MKWIAVSLALTSLLGCQTITTKRDPWESCNGDPPRNKPAFIYSGLRCDLRLIPWLFTEEQPFLSPIFGVASMIDLPLSAAADTVVLPWSLYQHFDRKHQTPPPEDPRYTGKRPDQ
jgi:uncharacterized protein YceK